MSKMHILWRIILWTWTKTDNLDELHSALGCILLNLIKYTNTFILHIFYSV